jgi:hypothetical protein
VGRNLSQFSPYADDVLKIKKQHMCAQKQYGGLNFELKKRK